MIRTLTVAATWTIAITTLQSSVIAQVLSVAVPLQETPKPLTHTKSIVRTARPLVSAETTPAENKIETARQKATAPSNHADRSPTRLTPTAQTEWIRRRYDTGTLQSEQQVMLNSSGNYENHGVFRMWDSQQRLIADGQYAKGLPSGKWQRTYHHQDASKLIAADQGAFRLPLVATFQFTEGKLDGEWRITDSAGQLVRKWNFDKGTLHGEVAVYFAIGSRKHDAYYERGVPVDTHREWTPGGELVHQHTFEHGRLLTESSFHHPDGTLKATGFILHPRYRLYSEPDWWNGGIRIRTSEPIGESMKVGQWIYYHPDGSKAQTGTYVRGEREGLFTWWNPGGQLMARGHFTGGQQDGEWTWWHASGAKQTVGHYQLGKATGSWIDWDENGTQIGMIDYSGPPKVQGTPVKPPTPRSSFPGIRRRTLDIPLTADRDLHRNLKVRPAESIRQ